MNTGLPLVFSRITDIELSKKKSLGLHIALNIDDMMVWATML